MMWSLVVPLVVVLAVLVVTRAAAGAPVPTVAPTVRPMSVAASASPFGVMPATSTSVPSPAPTEIQFTQGVEINWGRQIIVTLAWLAFMVVGIWVVMRYLYGRIGVAGLGAGTKTIQLLDRHMLGPQKALLLVAVPGKVLLLGMTDQQITTLSELRCEDLPSGSSPPRTTATFTAELRRQTENPPEGGVAVHPADVARLFGRKSTQTLEGRE